MIPGRKPDVDRDMELRDAIQRIAQRRLYRSYYYREVTQLNGSALISAGTVVPQSLVVFCSRFKKWRTSVRFHDRDKCPNIFRQAPTAEAAFLVT